MQCLFCYYKSSSSCGRLCSWNFGIFDNKSLLSQTFFSISILWFLRERDLMHKIHFLWKSLWTLMYHQCYSWSLEEPLFLLSRYRILKLIFELPWTHPNYLSLAHAITFVLILRSWVFYKSWLTMLSQELIPSLNRSPLKATLSSRCQVKLMQSPESFLRNYVLYNLKIWYKTHVII